MVCELCVPPFVFVQFHKVLESFRPEPNSPENRYCVFPGFMIDKGMTHEKDEREKVTERFLLSSLYLDMLHYMKSDGRVWDKIQLGQSHKTPCTQCHVLHCPTQTDS